jgi:hypothetical protein
MALRRTSSSRLVLSDVARRADIRSEPDASQAEHDAYFEEGKAWEAGLTWRAGKNYARLAT